MRRIDSLFRLEASVAAPRLSNRPFLLKSYRVISLQGTLRMTIYDEKFTSRILISAPKCVRSSSFCPFLPIYISNVVC